MTRTAIRWVAATAVGLLAGLAVWFATGLILVTAGLSFYAVHLTSYAALILWISTAPLIYLKTKKRNPQLAATYIAPLLIGIGLTISYFALTWALTHP